jgi:hypothetical protein
MYIYLDFLPNIPSSLPSYINRYEIPCHHCPPISTGTKFHVIITLLYQQVPNSMSALHTYLKKNLIAGQYDATISRGV